MRSKEDRETRDVIIRENVLSFHDDAHVAMNDYREGGGKRMCFFILDFIRKRNRNVTFSRQEIK